MQKERADKRQEHTDPVLNAKMHLVNNVSRERSYPHCAVGKERLTSTGY